MGLGDVHSLVRSLVRDESGEIADPDWSQAVALAVVRYSTDRPVAAVEAVIAPGGTLLDLPAGWQEDFSRLTGLTLAENDEPRAGAVERAVAGLRIRLASHAPAGTEFHVHYTRMHDAVPLADREAVASWAAALLLEQLASLYAGHRQPTINADAVDWQGKSRDYAARAQRLRQLYLDHLGIDPKRTVPAGAVVDFDRGASSGGDRLIHSQRRR